jgi:hypothetical protein
MNSWQILTGRLLKSLLAAVLLLAAHAAAQAQVADFQIVWVMIGEVAGSTGNQPTRAGRHLFMAADIADFSLKEVRVSRVEAEPVVTSLVVGEKFCLSALRIVASARDNSAVKQAPLSVSVRQDHRDALGLERNNNDICMQPISVGEYPIRFTSLLPAPDGTIRGAQIFVRVREP